MPPTEADLYLVRALADRIVAAGQGLVCSVVMVGSRAHGTATEQSDLDLVVLVETPAGEPRWTSDRILAEKRRLLAAVGPPPLRTDLWLRTTDQFDEARGVPGCMEHVAAFEGVKVYSRPTTRPPIRRRTEQHVRCQAVHDWLLDAVSDVERAAALEHGSQAPPGVGAPYTDPRYHARRAAQRSIVAACVWLGAPLPPKQQLIAEAVAVLATADGDFAAAIGTMLAIRGDTAAAARAVVSAVLAHLDREPALRPVLAPVVQRLRQVRALAG
jgi:hypothetical protein